jgi:ABC-type antimicrobial peptide transport system permease subunit
MAARGGFQMVPPGGTTAITVMPTVPPGLVLAVLLASTLGAVLAALLPALRAARLHPVEALRSL